MRSLRNLDTLGIGLFVHSKATDIVNTKDIYLAELRDHPNSSLAHLDVGTPWVRDAASCAEFLRAIFPSLKYLRGPSADNDHTNPSFNTERIQTWTNVSRLIREGVAGVADQGVIAKPSAVTLGEVEDDDPGYYYDSGADDEGSNDFSE